MPDMVDSVRQFHSKFHAETMHGIAITLPRAKRFMIAETITCNSDSVIMPGRLFSAAVALTY